MKRPLIPPPMASRLQVGDIIRLPITDQAHVCKIINRHRQYIVNTEHEKHRRAVYMMQYNNRNYARR